MPTPDLFMGHGLVERLRGFRRRLIVVHLVEQLAVAATGTCAVWSAALVIAGPGSSRAALWLLLACAVALLSTVCHTILQPWSLTTTATTLDRMFHLDERVMTALTCVDDGDAVSRLIVADAERRLQACRRRDIRPAWRIDPRLVMASVAVALITAAAAVGRGTPEDLEAPVQAGNSSVAGGAQAPGGRAASARQMLASSAAPSAPRGDQAAGSRSESGRQQSPAASSRAGSDQPSERRSDGEGVKTAPRNEPSRVEIPGSNEVRSPGGAGAASGSGVSASRSASGNVKAGEQGRGNGGAAAGGGATIGNSARGGGVQDAPRVAGKDQGRITRPDANASFAERYRLAVQAAESPVAQERIPDRLRGYVRDYFLAMRPGPGRADER